MQHQDSTSHNRDDLHFENEFKKLKLRAEFGIKLLENPSDSPEQENEWLNNLTEFEHCYADYNQVPVFVYIGEPSHISSVEKLSRHKLPEEIRKVKALLEANQIRVESLCEVSDREMYRFITEEVFWQEIPRQREHNHIKTFLYEEFYPNQAYEIKITVEEFFQRCFHQLWTLVEGQLCDKVQATPRSSMKREKVLQSLQNWVSLYENIQLTDIRFSKINTEKKQATAAACIYFEGLMPHSYELYNGQISVNFQLGTEDHTIWRMCGLFIPEIGL